MADKRLLTNRQWHTNGNWYAAKRIIKENFASVVFCDYMETTSSSGDWTGLVIQKLRNRLYVMIFSQENTFPCQEGYDIFTNDHVTAMVRDASTISNYRELFDEVCDFIYSD